MLSMLNTLANHNPIDYFVDLMIPTYVEDSVRSRQLLILTA